ncbi:MAG: AsmA-like C-terminal region-containing protein [Myxococcota bacterium]
MRRLWWLLGLALLLGVVLFSAAALLLRPDALRAPLQAALSQRLGRAVELGEMELGLWPTPRVRVGSIRVASDHPRAGAPPLLQADRIVLRPALLPLLYGQVVVRTLEIDAPRLTLEVDAEGLPVAPRLAPGPPDGTASPSSEPLATPEAPPPSDASAAGSGPHLAIQSIRVRGGSLRAGDWKVEELEAEGEIHLDGSARIEARASLPGLARLKSLQVDLTGLGQGSPRIALRGEVEEIGLDPLARRLGVVLQVRGTAEGSFDLEVEQGAVAAGGADLEVRIEDFRSGDLELAGPIPVQARLGESFAVDLTGTALQVGESLHKVPGQKLRLTGPLPRALPPERLDGLTLELAESKIPLSVQLDPLWVELGAAGVSLPALRAWLPAMLSDLEGSLKIEKLRVTPEPLRLDGQAILEGVSVELEQGRARATGPVRGLGDRLRAGPLDVELADQRLTAQVDYQLATGDLDLTLGTEGTDLGAWVAGLLGRDEAEGTLNLHAELQDALSAPMRRLRGSGSIQIDQGRVRGFSIAREALGAFAALPLLVARMRDRDPSRYLDERFDRLSATWTIRDGSLRTDDLTIVQRDARLELAGSVGLWDGALDLRGRLVIGPQLDAALAGGTRGRQKVIPIAGIGGTISRPRVRLDRTAAADVAATYLATDRLQEQLEDRLGPEGADAVRGIVDKLLRGGGRSR